MFPVKADGGTFYAAKDDPAGVGAADRRMQRKRPEKAGRLWRMHRRRESWRFEHTIEEVPWTMARFARRLKTCAFVLAVALLLALPAAGLKAEQPAGFILLSAGKDGAIGTPDDLYATGRGDVVKGAADLASLGLTQSDLVPSSGRTEILVGPFRYLVFEVCDHYGSNGATITEIEIRDRADSRRLCRARGL